LLRWADDPVQDVAIVVLAAKGMTPRVRPSAKGFKALPVADVAKAPFTSWQLRQNGSRVEGLAGSYTMSAPVSAFLRTTVPDVWAELS